MAREADREQYGEQTVDPENQLQAEDTLVDRGVEDVLDEGYSPPEFEPAHLMRNTTRDEQRAGESLDERLAEEEVDPDPYAEVDDEDRDDDAPDLRAGRLVAPDQGFGEDIDSEEIAEDIGVDGGGASAEEAAMHVIDPDEDF
jgi:hypothetical protein